MYHHEDQHKGQQKEVHSTDGHEARLQTLDISEEHTRHIELVIEYMLQHTEVQTPLQGLGQEQLVGPQEGGGPPR